MYNQGNWFNGGFGNGYGYAPQPQRQVINQTLTREEVQHIRAKGGKGFNVMVTEDQMMRSMCNHTDPDTHNFSVVCNDDGSCTCTICGERFTPLLDISPEEAQQICADHNDLFQTCKMFAGFNIPKDTAREFYKTYALASKIPELWELAQENARKLGSINNIVDPNGNGNIISAYNSFMSPGIGMASMNYNNGGYYQQPAMQPQPQQYGAGYYQQAPMQQPMMQPQASMPQPMMQPQFQPQYNAGMPNPMVDRPIGQVVQQPQQSNMPTMSPNIANNAVVQQTVSAGPSPMAAAPSAVPATAGSEIKKSFKA